MNKVLIGESSWDKDCFERCVGQLDCFYLHNDFFNGSNKLNIRVINRIKVVFLSFVYSLRYIQSKKDVYFSSLNSEVMIVALLLSCFKCTHLFLPNVIGSLDSYGKLFRLLIKAYSGRIVVTDVITKESLRGYNSKLSTEHFSFNLPAKEKLKDITYIVAFPASYSHKNTSELARNMYIFSEKIYNKLSQKNCVFILPHPRDKEYMNEKYKNTITSEEIKIISGDICYISAASSLSLNRRYNGEYGCWVSIGTEHGLMPSLEGSKDKLIDIRYFL